MSHCLILSSTDQYCPVAPCLDIFTLKLNLSHFKSDASRQVCRYAGMKVCKYANMQVCNKKLEQAGAELGQAQLKLGLDFTLIVCRFSLYRFFLIVLVGLI